MDTQKLARRSLLTIAVMVFFVGAAAQPASAADTTWFDGAASVNSRHAEGTAYHSRDGIKAGFTEHSVIGQAKITTWYGDYSSERRGR